MTLPVLTTVAVGQAGPNAQQPLQAPQGNTIDDAIQQTIISLTDAAKVTQQEAEKLAKAGNTTGASFAVQNAQALQKLTEDIVGMLVNTKVLAFKLGPAFARAIGLTTL